MFLNTGKNILSGALRRALTKQIDRSLTMTSTLSKGKIGIDEKIKKNISQKINSLQFKSLKEDIFNPKDSSYLNPEVLRMVILKSIQKSNTTFANEVFEEMVQHQIIPDDATYTTLIEALLADGYTDDAFEIYIQAYLNGIVLDLEIFYSLFERLEKRDISYLNVAYMVLKSTLIPSKFIMDHLIYTAAKAKAADFLKILHEDLEKFNIDKVDNPKSHRELRGGSKKKKSYESKRKSKRMPPPLFIIPFDPSSKNLMKGGWGKGDPLAYLQDLSSAFGRYRWEEDDEDFASDQSDLDYEEISVDEDSDGYREDFTSESDNDQ